MPRSIDPSTIATGGGFAVPGTVSQSAISPGEVGPVSGTVDAHIEAPAGAHPATAISTTDVFSRYIMGANVQGNFDELSALVPPAMGGVGSNGVAWLGSTNTGVPDWGSLKLNDGALTPTGNTAADTTGVYPYYYRAPVSPSSTGVDPSTDPMFNVLDGTYTGGGTGTTHAAFTTVSQGGGGADGYPTWRLRSAVVNPVAIVSGICSPADRGVLALVKWGAGLSGTPAAPAANVADIQARCVAALLLGKGAADNGCDGTPGGIFTDATGSQRAVGTITNVANPAAPYTITINLSGLPGGPAAPVVFTATAGAPANPFQFQVGGSATITTQHLALAINSLYYPDLVAAVANAGVITLSIAQPGTVGNSVTIVDSSATYTIVNPTGGTDADASPYSFPGRAAGQYNLDEIHQGASTTALVPPFVNPAAGQVRLLTDPTAVSFSPATVAGGLPIFGGTSHSVGTTPVAFLPFGIGGGTDGNFFAYRLPYLKDYSAATGIHYTPAGEKSRFTSKLLPAAGTAMPNAGNYSNFTADFWAYQIARYRHRFTLVTGGAVDRRDGSYALVHFKKEAYFEAYVRDGVVPTSAQLYSVNLVQWAGNTSPFNQLDNIAAPVSPAATASSYNALRADIQEDQNGLVVPTLVTATYVLSVGANNIVNFSGIKYYTPLDRTTGNPAASLTTVSLDFTHMFAAGYRSHDTVPVAGPLAADERKYALNQNMAFLSLSPFSYSGTESPVVSGITSTSAAATLFPGRLGAFRRQRVEFGYADLHGGTTNPAAADHATYSLVAGSLAAGLNFTGDTATPAFTQNAKVRVFFRRPLAVDGATGFSLPYLGGNTASSRGFTLTEGSGKPILFHSMRESPATGTVLYGNAFTLAKANLDTTKDISERFLDEVYRYPENWAPLPAGLNPQAQLQGPGLPFGVGAVAVPVRPINADASYPGWYFQGLNGSVLTNVAPLASELQVAGLPARNPDYTEGVTDPFPSRGLLVYPQKNYTGYLPANADYSVLTGDRAYVRAFDAGAANVGNNSVKIKLWGVDLSDFAYTPGSGPGTQSLAIMVKLPGVTTWMDAGRVDGSGPSKQDILLDGAGCLVIGPNTFSATDTTSQIHYTQVEVALGPIGSLFLNTETPARCPILVKVILKNTFGAALNFEQGGEDAATSTLRGLVGIDIV